VFSPEFSEEEQKKMYIEKFMAHFYNNSWDEIKHAYDEAAGEMEYRFGTRNVHLLPRKFMTYEDAFRSNKNLRPKFDNVFDLIQAYSNYMTRLNFNNSLMQEISKLEEELGQKLILRPGSKDENVRRQYTAARENGWMPSEEPYLTWRIVGSTKKGEPKFAKTSGTAYIHPAIGWALKEVFRAQPQEGRFWKKYDLIGAVLRTTRTSFSFFHFGPLAGSGFASNGFSIMTPEWWRVARKVLADPEMRRQYFLEGGRIGNPTDVNPGLVVESFRKIADKMDALPLHGGYLPGVAVRMSAAFQAKINEKMWDVFHPMLKLGTWHRMRLKEQVKLNNGKITEAEFHKRSRNIAAMTNDIFGGQAWEMQRVLANPQLRKVLYRAGGYVDWSWSALRQAAMVVAPGHRGNLSRKYWLTYGMAFVALQNMMNLLFTGMVKDPDDDDKEEGIKIPIPGQNVWWVPSLAQTCNKNEDPKHFGAWPFIMDFKLPDIDWEIGGTTFNIGRDESGRQIYSHTGKQALEIPRYITDPIGATFSKANPLLQIAGIQYMGGSPYKGDRYPARGKYDPVLGEFLPWDATAPGTLANVWSRLKEVANAAVPFSLRDFYERGPLPIVGLPVSKGISIRAARQEAAEAYVSGDMKKLNGIINTLKADRRNAKQIKSVLSSARKAAAQAAR